MKQDRELRARLRETFAITLDTGESFAGVLYSVDSSSLVLRDAVALAEQDHARTSVDGELILPRDRVLYLQRIPPLILEG